MEQEHPTLESILKRIREEDYRFSANDGETIFYEHGRYFREKGGPKERIGRRIALLKIRLYLAELREKGNEAKKGKA